VRSLPTSSSSNSVSLSIVARHQCGGIDGLGRPSFGFFDLDPACNVALPYIGRTATGNGSSFLGGTDPGHQALAPKLNVVARQPVAWLSRIASASFAHFSGSNLMKMPVNAYSERPDIRQSAF